MIPKCEQYWPDKKDKTKKAGHMEITWRDETPIRNGFTQQKFEIANNAEGNLDSMNYNMKQLNFISLLN